MEDGRGEDTVVLEMHHAAGMANGCCLFKELSQ